MITKTKITIIGSGLAGAILAHRLSDVAEVTVVEQGDDTSDHPVEIVDAGYPANLSPHVGSGPGGSTRFWHNGLIRIPASNLARWPLARGELDRWIAEARHLLGGAPEEAIQGDIAALQRAYTAVGLPPDLFGEPLYYPKSRSNIWKRLKAGRSADLVRGRARSLAIAPDGRICGVVLDHGGFVESDYVIVAAGGLGTPVLLQHLLDRDGNEIAAQAGFNYEDHPLAFVADFSAPVEFSRLFNYPCNGGRGRLRLPLVAQHDGVDVAFYIRPGVRWSSDKRTRVKSSLNDLRNKPLALKNYIRLMSNFDDILDILSFKLGIAVPTTHFSLLMVAGQPPSTHRAIYEEAQTGRIIRDWRFSDDYLATLRGAIAAMLARLSPVIGDICLHDDWVATVQSSAHHSGTARMGLTAADGVCNTDGKVFGLPNLFVCDGSLIPDSGYANTGLTIAALALRMADFLRREKLGG